MVGKLTQVGSSFLAGGQPGGPGIMEEVVG